MLKYCGELVLGSFYNETLIEELLRMFSFMLKNETLLIGILAHGTVTVITKLTHLLDLKSILQKVK